MKLSTLIPEISENQYPLLEKWVVENVIEAPEPSLLDDIYGNEHIFGNPLAEARNELRVEQRERLQQLLGKHGGLAEPEEAQSE